MQTPPQSQRIPSTASFKEIGILQSQSSGKRAFLKFKILLMFFTLRLKSESGLDCLQLCMPRRRSKVLRISSSTISHMEQKLKSAMSEPLQDGMRQNTSHISKQLSKKLHKSIMEKECAVSEWEEASLSWECYKKFGQDGPT